MTCVLTNTPRLNVVSWRPSRDLKPGAKQRIHGVVYFKCYSVNKSKGSHGRIQFSCVKLSRVILLRCLNQTCLAGPSKKNKQFFSSSPNFFVLLFKEMLFLRSFLHYCFIGQPAAQRRDWKQGRERRDEGGYMQQSEATLPIWTFSKVSTWSVNYPTEVLLHSWYSSCSRAQLTFTNAFNQSMPRFSIEPTICCDSLSPRSFINQSH